jgi:hypothetical protein
MARTLQETEEICSYIRATLENAINMWMCKCNTRRNYSEFDNLYTIQEEVWEEESQQNYDPQSPYLQYGTGPSDEYGSKYLTCKSAPPCISTGGVSSSVLCTF